MDVSHNGVGPSTTKSTMMFILREGYEHGVRFKGTGHYLQP
jgi:hypothetical protein